MEQTQVQKQKQASAREVDEPEVEAKDERDEELDNDVSDLLDEIDAVLEPEAQKFVAAYIQKGGQ
jgi:ubiquitin-like protein Pup